MRLLATVTACDRSRRTVTPRSRLRPRTLAATVIATAALAGCTASAPADTPTARVTHDRETTAPITPSPAPTPTPTQAAPDLSSVDLTTPPPRPAALDAPADEDAAADVAEYFVLLFPYAAATHDLKGMQALSHDDCRYCNRIIELIGDYESQGVRTEGGAIVVNSTDVMARSADYFTVTVRLTQEPSREIAPDGSIVEEDPGATNHPFEVDVMHTDDGWKVIGLVEPS